MFSKGEYIIYGNYGVCRVEEVGTLESSAFTKGRIYYTLCPEYSAGRKIYTPVDNDKVIMRPVLTKEEALRLIEDIDSIDSLEINDDKKKELEYKEALKTCNCRELVKVIKTIYYKKQLRIASGKKSITSEDKYFQMAEDNLYGELAIPLNMEKQEVKEYIISKVNQ